MPTPRRRARRWRSRRRALPARLPSLARHERRRAGEDAEAVELCLDAQEAVVLGDALGTRRSTRLDLTGPGGNGQIRNCRVLGLAAAMADDRAPTVALRRGDYVERLGKRADLVELHQDGVGAALEEPARHALRVGHEEVVTDELHAPTEPLREQLPAGPVILGQAVLEG